MSEVVSLSELRAEREHDASLWLPLDCLKALVRDLESGAMKPVDMVYVAMARDTDGGVSYPCYVAGAKSRMETRGLLAKHLHDAMASSTGG